jgi:cation/acetate symporter
MPARPALQTRPSIWTAARINGEAVLRPGFISNPVDSVSLELALMFATAGLPHILMRFYTVPNSMTAGNSVSYTVFFIGYFHLLLFVLGFGATVILLSSTVRVDILQHDSAWFPVCNPAIVTMPASFLVGSGVSLFHAKGSAQAGILKPKGRIRLR